MTGYMQEMARRRNRHRQLELSLRRDKNGQRRGIGKRVIRNKLGRPARDPRRPSEPHKTRASVSRREPQHVTLRVVDRVPYLRRRHYYAQLRRALSAVWRRTDFRVVHFSLQGSHVHLVCEARHKHALASGVKAFESSFAQRVNRVISRRTGNRTRGQVFRDRYHVRPITKPTDVRNCLAYVLNNFRHHRLSGPTLYGDKIDEFSSGALFMGWRERRTCVLPNGYEPPAIKPPSSWLLARGWKRAHPISVYEVPSARSPD